VAFSRERGNQLWQLHDIEDAHLEENLAAASIRLTSDEFRTIASL
jgi:aryl-alcohol dehydrogenase-like predicted oxidoreductase